MYFQPGLVALGSLKDANIDCYNSQYIRLLDAHTLKGGILFANPSYTTRQNVSSI